MIKTFALQIYVNENTYIKVCSYMDKASNEFLTKTKNTYTYIK